MIIIKKNEEIKFAKQSKEGIAKLICKKIVEEFTGYNFSFGIGEINFIIFRQISYKVKLLRIYKWIVK